MHSTAVSGISFGFGAGDHDFMEPVALDLLGDSPRDLRLGVRDLFRLEAVIVNPAN